MPADTELSASGREIIEFLTSFQGGCTRVDDDKIVDADGRWLLQLDERYLLKTFGRVFWGLDDSLSFEEAFTSWRNKRQWADPRRESPLYPYGFAAKTVRAYLWPQRSAPTDQEVVDFESRLAEAVNVERFELAEMLAEFYLGHEDEIVNAALQRLEE